MLIQQSKEVESVRKNHSFVKILSDDRLVGFGQLHDDDLDSVANLEELD